MFRVIRNWLRRRRFQEGKIVSRFIARDVRRDILVVSASRIDEGVLTGRVRTTNVLYLSRGLVDQPEFGPLQELRLDEMWHWTGQSWGGLPDATSIVEHLDEDVSDQGESGRGDMYRYLLRPGYGSDELLIELLPETADQAFFEALFSVLRQMHTKVDDIFDLWVNNEVMLRCESDHGPFVISKDVWGFVFIMALENQEAIVEIEKALGQSGRFRREMVNDDDYA